MTSITQGLIHRGTIISVGWRNTIIKSVTNNSSRTRTLCQILCNMFNIRIISFILHNNLRKLMFWEVKQFAQDHTVSDREGRSCMSVWPKSLCAGSAWYCSHRGNSWHSIYSVKMTLLWFGALIPGPGIPASGCLKQLSPLRTLKEEASSRSEAFPVNSFSFPAWSSWQVFSKKESQGNHISVWMWKENKDHNLELSLNGLEPLSLPLTERFIVASLLLVTGMACLSLLQKILPGRGLSTLWHAECLGEE